MTFAKMQPKHGDIIAKCPHNEEKNEPFHWLYLPPPGAIKYECDKHKGHCEAHWVVICDVCYKWSQGDITKVELPAHGEFLGNDPIIEEVTN